MLLKYGNKMLLILVIEQGVICLPKMLPKDASLLNLLNASDVKSDSMRKYYCYEIYSSTFQIHRILHFYKIKSLENIICNNF